MTALSDLIARLEARAIDELEYRCTNSHAFCYGGTSAGIECPYCDRSITSDGELLQEAIAALKAREAGR